MTTKLKTLAIALIALPTLLSAQSVPQQRSVTGVVAPMFLTAPQAVQSHRLTTGAAPQQTAGDNSVFCGNGNMFYFYEEDENGNEVPGTRQYGCDYD